MIDNEVVLGAFYLYTPPQYFEMKDSRDEWSADLIYGVSRKLFYLFVLMSV